MKLIALLLIFLPGCASLSVEEKFDQATACQVTADTDCRQLWADWNSAVEMQNRRDAERKSPCDKGYVLYCDRWCSSTKMRGETAGVCVKQSSLSWY